MEIQGSINLPSTIRDNCMYLKWPNGLDSMTWSRVDQSWGSTLVVQLVSKTSIFFLTTMGPPLRTEDLGRDKIYLIKWGKSLFANKEAKQLSEEVITWAGKQMLLGNVDKWELVINETRQKEIQPKCTVKHGNVKRTAWWCWFSYCFSGKCALLSVAGAHQPFIIVVMNADSRWSNYLVHVDFPHICLVKCRR